MEEAQLPIEVSPRARDAGGSIAEAIAIMERLRAPGGCPWDREQTFDSIKRYTLEETYEVFDAIERRDWANLKDELGDLLLQVLFYSQMAAEAGYFSMGDVAENLTAKLVRRHPHVFGEAQAADTGSVLRNWEQIKREERAAKGRQMTSLLDAVPRSMPATMEAEKLGSAAAKVGFDWQDVGGLFEKLQEEISELREELGGAGQIGPQRRSRAEEEFGDVLFTVMNMARHLKIDPESALRRSSAKFRARFGMMEQTAGGGDRLRETEPAELEELWRQAKAAEDVEQNA